VGQWNMDDMSTCRAAVPRIAQHLAGHMTGGEPIIEAVRAVPSWSECGEPAVAVHFYRYANGHVKRRATCTVHAPEPGQVGCRDCWDEGREVPMAVSDD
jgi:hypothetical protein